MRVASDLWHSKTTWTACMAIVTALGAALSHEITWVQFAVGVFAALQTVFIRDTIAKLGDIDL